MTTQNVISGQDKKAWLRETVNSLNAITDALSLSVTGEVSVAPVRHNAEAKLMEVCLEELAEKFGVYVQVKGQYKRADYLEWYWLEDFEKRVTAQDHADWARAILPAYFFISECVASRKAFFDAHDIDAVSIIEGEIPVDAPAGAIEFGFYGKVYTCLNASYLLNEES